MSLYSNLNTQGMILELKSRGYIVTKANLPGSGYQPTSAEPVRPPPPKPFNRNKNCCCCCQCKK